MHAGPVAYAFRSTVRSSITDAPVLWHPETTQDDTMDHGLSSSLIFHDLLDDVLLLLSWREDKFKEEGLGCNQGGREEGRQSTEALCI